ncbi:DUF5313 family protein [Spirillospora sp. NPDC048911]|uniref:DUF5313 family protein n=1 Tax=Spirillospora sp. NPDC048911 TaxID=3364527 RepID=UPI00371C2CC0
MTRLVGDPGAWRWARYALGFRLPAENRDWVRHDLTDAGWRGRMLLRHLAVMVPVCVGLGSLPAEWWIRVMVGMLALVTSTFTVAISAEDLRRSRLRQHGFDR